MTPITDLCSVCQKNSTILTRGAYLREEEKSEVCIIKNHNYCHIITFNVHQTMKRAQLHLSAATEARTYLREQVGNLEILFLKILLRYNFLLLTGTDRKYEDRSSQIIRHLHSYARKLVTPLQQSKFRRPHIFRLCSTGSITLVHSEINNFYTCLQVHYQPGPIYFLTPRKCGVCCEALPQQVRHIIINRGCI